MIKNGNYMTCIGWMRTLLNLSLSEMAVYAIIYGFSQDRTSVYNLAIDYIEDWTGLSERTVQNILNRLVELGYISSEKRDGKTTLYRCVPLQDLHPRKNCTPAEIAPPQNLRGNPRKICAPNIKDNINISNTNIDVVVVESASEPAPTCTQATTTSFLNELFERWWLTYGMPEYEGEKEECRRYWFGYSETERNKVISHTELFAPVNLAKNPKSRKHPYWYLKDKYYLNDLSTLSNNDIPTLTGSEADLAKRNGEEVWNCKMPDGSFKMVLLKDAEKYNLEKMWRF